MAMKSMMMAPVNMPRPCRNIWLATPPELPPRFTESSDSCKDERNNELENDIGLEYRSLVRARETAMMEVMTN